MNTQKKANIIDDVNGLYQGARDLLGKYGAPATSFTRLLPHIPVENRERCASLVQLIVRDSIIYNRRLEEIRERQAAIPDVKRESHYAKMMAIGSQYIQLSESINATLMPNCQEFDELARPQPVSV